MAIVAAQEEKANFVTKIAFFHSTFPEFDLATDIQPGDILTVSGFVRQARNRILLQQSSHITKTQEATHARFPKIKETLLGFLNETDCFLLSEPLYMESLTVSDNHKFKLSSVACAAHSNGPHN